jgi:hypothetical protein
MDKHGNALCYIEGNANVYFSNDKKTHYIASILLHNAGGALIMRSAKVSAKEQHKYVAECHWSGLTDHK